MKKSILTPIIVGIIAICCTSCGGIQEVKTKGESMDVVNATPSAVQNSASPIPTGNIPSASPNFETPLPKQEEPQETIKPIELNNTYTARIGAVYSVDANEFKFSYPDNWQITMEELQNEVMHELVEISNDRGATVTYMDIAGELGRGGRFMYQIEASKVADASFVPTVPVGTVSDYCYSGNFIVAKLKPVGELYMNIDSEYTPIDEGYASYAVVPESYVGLHNDIVGSSGLYDEFSFEYPRSYVFIAEPPEGGFTTQEEQEVIAILKSFRLDELPTLSEAYKNDHKAGACQEAGAGE